MYAGAVRTVRGASATRGHTRPLRALGSPFSQWPDSNQSEDIEHSWREGGTCLRVQEKTRRRGQGRHERAEDTKADDGYQTRERGGRQETVSTDKREGRDRAAHDLTRR